MQHHSANFCSSGCAVNKVPIVLPRRSTLALDREMTVVAVVGWDEDQLVELEGRYQPYSTTATCAQEVPVGRPMTVGPDRDQYSAGPRRAA